MRVALLAAMVGLAAAAVAYAAFALVASLLARAAMRRGTSATLAVRLLPIAAALVSGLVIVAPGFVLREPADGKEAPGLVATGLAAAGLALAGSLARRAWRARQATRSVLAQWNASARPVAIANGPAPAYRIEHPFPVIAVVGVFRPRLYIEETVLQALTAEELSAVLEHEAAHIRARDNAKRWLLACAPGVGWRRTALALERAWEETSEHDADRGAHGALDLASALVKTARLAPSGVQLRLPAAAFHGGGDVASRVKDLVDGCVARPERLGWGSALLAAVVAATAAAPLLWATAHGWAETIIHLR
jgi:Zn-dependent protease with chaperone function